VSAHPFGTIVLAAYDPEPELFRRQLESLCAQTVSTWECVIAVDGDPVPVAALTSRLTDGDERFRIVGDGSRLGFYLNFERGIAAVSPRTEWIALCDQDDRWDADKIERLLPHLAEVSLVSAQARLVAYPSGTLLGHTDRHDHGPLSTILANQFTGSLCVFSPELLRTALPFPRASTRAAAHDHWLAVVAGTYRGTRVVEDLTQDYMQHDTNVFGDPSRLGPGGIRQSIANALEQARRYEGSRSPFAIARTTFWAYVGWRQLMVDTLTARGFASDDGFSERDAAFGAGRRWNVAQRALRTARASDVVPAPFVLEYRASWLAGALTGGRRAVERAIASGGD